MSLRRKLVAAVAAAVAAAGLFALAPLASAGEVTTSSSGLYITYVKCYETEDWGNDEIYLTIKDKYGNFRKYIWWNSTIRGKSFTDGQGVSTKIRVYSGDEVHLTDADSPDGHDHLGWKNVKWADAWYQYGTGESPTNWKYKIHVRPIYS